MDSVNKLYTSKDVGYFDSVRKEIQPLLPRNRDRVLEVGCGSGATLQWLKSEMGCGWVGGVELTEDAAGRARERLDFFLEGNIEKIELPFDNSSLDLILCLDVLEHLVDPWLMVKRLSLLLKPGGALIVSLPNICHRDVMMPLLLRNRWDYEPSGILDRTHLRFFTKKTAIELLAQGGLRVDKIEAIVAINKGLKSWFFEWVINPLTLHILHRFFVRQYMVRAIK